MRRLTGLERECERRYAALRLSQEQAVIIRQLLAEKEASRLLEIDLRAQLTDRIQAIHELEQALRLLHPHLDEPAAAVTESIVIPPEVDPELEQLREKNRLLQLQLKQVQEELEHYVLLAQGQRCLASPAAVDVPHPLSEPLATREQVSDTINRNRARLQLSTREP